MIRSLSAAAAFLVFFLLPLYAPLLHAASGSSAASMRTEYLSNPIGIDARLPRFTWEQQDARPGAMQTARRILVDTDSAEVAGGRGRMWNTGWIASNASLATYAGRPLEPFTRYFWRVDIKDHAAQSSAGGTIAWFETGMMEMKNWHGAWISDTDNRALKPAAYFRRTFSMRKSVASARAYIAAAGLYELSINGNAIGDHRLDPMYTRFDRRTLYVTYDVTAQLRMGYNAVGVLLGNGWYNHQSTAVWDFHKAVWRARPAFCMDLRITFTDGSTETISTGKEWKTALGPVIFNSIYTAEHQDARLAIPGWNTAVYVDTSWKHVVYRSAPSANITAQAMHPVRNCEEIPAKSVARFSDTNYVFDIGRNIAGVSRLTVTGARGTVIQLKHAERLYPNGHADLSNIDVHYRPTDGLDPFQTDVYILDGNGTETFMPHFNYKGFQYIEVSANAPISLTKESLTAFFMHSDVPATGRVSSSNPVIDKIWSAANNSYLSNLFGYPTDCPQREKNGWTGDAQIAIETGLYGFDGITVYEKWLADHRDEQQPNGVLPSIIPTSGWGYEWGNGPDWTSTIAIIPWNLYLFYGDTKPLSDCYENIKRYVDHIDEISPSGLTAWGLGDWVPVKSLTPVELTSTCYYYADAVILSKAARILGHAKDHTRYAALAAKIRHAFNDKYLNREMGIYGTGVQTALSTPLYWGLVPEDVRPRVAANLAARVEADSFHLDVGLLGQKAILNALSENGHADAAYRIASQTAYPSWGWWIMNGATTLYENWKIDAQNDISLNHIMFGEIGAWLYKGLGGITPDESQPGFRNVILAPKFVEGLDRFEAAHRGPRGTIVSSWSRTGMSIAYTVTVPANSTATVVLPAAPGDVVSLNGKRISGTTTRLRSGTHRFVIAHRPVSVPAGRRTL